MDLSALNQTAVFYALGWAIAHSLWQMGLLWLIYQLVFGLYRNIKPGIRYSASTLFLSAGFFWFILTFISQFNTYQSINRYIRNLPEPIANELPVVGNSGDSSGLFSGEIIFRVIETFIPYLSVAYLFIITFLFIRLINAYVYTQKIRTTGLLSAGEKLESRLGEFLRKLSMNRSVKIYLSELISVPATVGFFKPVILLPVAAINHLSPEQAESIILHELAHIRRQDYLLNLMVSVMETLLFFNPFAHLFSVGLKKDRELHCDDFVMAFNRDPKNYATALLSLEKMRLGSTPALALAATGQDGLLLNRVKRILNVQPQNLRYGEKLVALLVISGLLSALAWIDPVPLENRQIQPAAAPVNSPSVNEPGQSKKPLTLSELVKQSVKDEATNAPVRKPASGQRMLRSRTDDLPAFIASPPSPEQTGHFGQYPGDWPAAEKPAFAPQDPAIEPFAGVLPLRNGSYVYNYPIEMTFPDNLIKVLPSIPFFTQPDESVNTRENLEKFFEAFRNYSFAYDDENLSGNLLRMEQLEKLRLLYHGQKNRRSLRDSDSLQTNREQRKNRVAARNDVWTTQPGYRFFSQRNLVNSIAGDSVSGAASVWHFAPQAVYRVRKSVNGKETRSVKTGRVKSPHTMVRVPDSPDPEAEPHNWENSAPQNTGKTFNYRVTKPEVNAVQEFSLDLTNAESAKDLISYIQPRSARVVINKKRKAQTGDHPRVQELSEKDGYLIMIQTENDIIHIRLENKNEQQGTADAGSEKN